MHANADQVNNSCRLYSLGRTLRAYRQQGLPNDSVLYKMTTSSVIYIYIRIKPQVSRQSQYGQKVYMTVFSLIQYTHIGAHADITVNKWLFTLSGGVDK